MNNKKSTKRALISSVLSLSLCLTMLIGTTFAWFTDSVTSTGNIIKSGKLDVEMQWADGKTDPLANEEGQWTDASKGPIFAYEKWEPGYTVVRHIKISNVGTLALKYVLNIVAHGEVSDLAEVIDVYYFDPATKIADRTALKDSTPMSTLKAALETIKTTGTGNLEAGETIVLTLALKMQESAGNTYQDMSIGSDFAVQLLATQLTSEIDSFDNQYDADAEYGIEVSNADELAKALAAGGSIRLVSDIEATSTIAVPTGVSAILDLNGKTLTGTLHKNDGAVLKNDGDLTVTGGKITNTAVNGDSVINNKGTLVLDGVNIEGAPMDSTGYPAYALSTSGKLTVEEGTNISVNRGAISTSNGAEVVINGGSLIVSDAADGRNMTLHTIYAYGYDSKLTINDGYFEMGHTSTSGASVICPAGATINIYGGDFRDAMDDNNWTSTGNFQNYMGYGAPVNVYGGTFDDETVKKNLAVGYKTIENEGLYVVVTDKTETVKNAEGLKNVLASGNDVFMTNDIETPSAESNAYGKTGINVTNGQTIDGNGKTLSVNGANGTWDSAINTTGGTIKNLKIDSGFRGIFVNHNSEKSAAVILENVIIDGPVYTISCDQGTKQGLTATNCTFNGWTSYAATIGDVVFENCNFGEGAGYAFCRPYAPTTFVGCDFAEGYKIDARAAVTFENCTVGGVTLTAENLSTLVTSNLANATVK